MSMRRISRRAGIREFDCIKLAKSDVEPAAAVSVPDAEAADVEATGKGSDLDADAESGAIEA